MGKSEYLCFLYERLVVAKELLSSDGGMFVYLDYRMADHARVLIDEIFGSRNFSSKLSLQQQRQVRL